jgi:3'-phosphoadenosine 5'-phosphosulfate sulfotransferase (PAPS reductase)/FAD synthetase
MAAVEGVTSGTLPSVAASTIVPVAALKPLSDCEMLIYNRALDSAREVITSCFGRFLNEAIGISFNGGKDSVVMMELLIEHVGADTVSKCHIFMFGEDDEFEDIRTFRESYLAHRLPAAVLQTLPQHYGIRGGLEVLRNEHSLEAVFIGTRKDDPSAKYQKTSMEPTTAGWPQMMRYCPVFEFCYHEVWMFLSTRSVPVCKLYGCGYTSLGRIALTVPNQALLITDADAPAAASSGVEKDSKRAAPKYLPAWLLPDGSRERDCRLAAAAKSVL